MKILKIIPLMILFVVCFNSFYNKPSKTSEIANLVKSLNIRDGKAIS